MFKSNTTLRTTLMMACIVTTFIPQIVSADDLIITSAKKATEKAVRFYRENVSVSGGSVYQVSSDLKQREGEGRVGPREAWIEPPGTSYVGKCYLRCWQLTGEQLFYDAMLEVANGLMHGQLVSGGWGENIEFDPLLRPKYAYRLDHRTYTEKLRNTTTFDDNKSQSSLMFLMLVDQELEFSNAAIHEAVMHGLQTFALAQYPIGAWPQKFSGYIQLGETESLAASFPKEWSRTYPRQSYSHYYTLNDGTIVDLIELMLVAAEVYKDQQWLNVAKKGGDFLLRAQLPKPQPGWAQQYNSQMQPAWARKFEPPAITGLESQGVINMLMTLYEQTGEEKYLKPVGRAIEYYKSIHLPDGRLARFYEMGTNRPLYFTKEYELVYRDDDLPTHYGFKVGSKFDRLEKRYGALRKEWSTESLSAQ